MKKLLIVFSAVLFLTSSIDSFAQIAQDSWEFGFGFSRPNSIEIDLKKDDANSYGGFLSLQRNFSEHVALRFQGLLNHLSFEWGSEPREGNSFVISGNFDLLYKFVPCEPVTPFLAIGVGGFYPIYDNLPNENIVGKKFGQKFGQQFNLGFGATFRLSEDWKLLTAVDYHQTDTDVLETVSGTATSGRGIWGGNKDSYISMNLGLTYTFAKGEQSKYCQLYNGISVDVPETDYEKVENIVKKHIPEVVEKQVVVEKESEPNWVLVGVNFDFNKATLKDESYPILFHAVQVLLLNPDLKVEIQGYTDNIGSDEYNMKLGEKRAEAVRDYLISKGVSADRLTVRSFGENQPIADNTTANGRAMNRRVEFKVLN